MIRKEPCVIRKVLQGNIKEKVGLERNVGKKNADFYVMQSKHDEGRAEEENIKMKLSFLEKELEDIKNKFKKVKGEKSKLEEVVKQAKIGKTKKDIESQTRMRIAFPYQPQIKPE